MRADRLLSLLLLLQTRGQMTAQELANALEVSPRTIYRDLDALSIAGVPVYAERGPQGGCRLLESYRTNLTGLKEDEVRALFMLTVPGLLADLGLAREAEAALLKLTAALPTPFQQDAALVRQRLLLDPAGWFQPEEAVPYLPLLQEAIWQTQRVVMLYRRGDGSYVKRVLDPYGLVAKASIWYVVARSFHWVQVFRVSRIAEASLLASRFTRPEDFDLAGYWRDWCQRFERGQARYDVTLRVAPAGVPALVQTFGEGVHALLATAGQDDEPGRVRLTLAFESADAACRQLVGIGPHIEVLAPAGLRQQMADMALAVLAQYGAAHKEPDGTALWLDDGEAGAG